MTLSRGNDKGRRQTIPVRDFSPARGEATRLIPGLAGIDSDRYSVGYEEYKQGRSKVMMAQMSLKSSKVESTSE